MPNPFRSWAARGPLLVGVLICAFASPAAAGPTFAVLSIDELGPDDEGARRAREALQEAATALLRSAVKKPTAVQRAEARVRATHDACRDGASSDACLAAIGGAARATRVLAIAPRVLEQVDAVELIVIDSESGERKRRVAAARSGTSFDAPMLLRRALLKSEKLAALELRAQPAGARVLVDGLVVGTAPLPGPLEHLAPGEHAVRVEAEGYEPSTSTVAIAEGERGALAVSLTALPPPPPPPPTAEEIAAANAAQARAGRRALRLAVYDFELNDVDGSVGRVVTDSVVFELRKLDRVSVIGMDEVREMLDIEAQKQLVGCADESCLSEIADALGVDGLVSGSLARIGDEHVFSMRRIDQREARVVGAVNQRLVAETGEEFLAAVGPAVEELFPDQPLRAGAERGVSDELVLRLNPPPLDPWVFWTGVGTTAMVTVAGAVLGAVSLFTLSSYGELVDRGREAPIAAADLKSRADANNAVTIATWSTLGGGVGLAAATGAAFFFVDWEGVRDAAE
jgi:hypothetical protein